MQNWVIPSYKTGFARDAGESKAPELRKGLVAAYLPFLGSTAEVLFDWSGGLDVDGIHNGTLIGMELDTDWEIDQQGYCLHFDATTTEYVTPGVSFETVFRGSFSISLSMRLDDGQPAANRFFCGCLHPTVVGVQPISQIYCYVRPSGKLSFYYHSDSNGIYAVKTAVFPNGRTEWMNVTFVGDATINGVGGLKIYTNGIEDVLDGVDNGDTAGITFDDFRMPDSRPFMIGSRIFFNGVMTSAMDGQLGYFLLWDRALSGREIIQHHSNPFRMWERRVLPGYKVFVRASRIIIVK